MSGTCPFIWYCWPPLHWKLHRLTFVFSFFLFSFFFFTLASSFRVFLGGRGQSIGRSLPLAGHPRGGRQVDRQRRHSAENRTWHREQPSAWTAWALVPVGRQSTVCVQCIDLCHSKHESKIGLVNEISDEEEENGSHFPSSFLSRKVFVSSHLTLLLPWPKEIRTNTVQKYVMQGCEVTQLFQLFWPG